MREGVLGERSLVHAGAGVGCHLPKTRLSKTWFSMTWISKTRFPKTRFPKTRFPKTVLGFCILVLVALLAQGAPDAIRHGDAILASSDRVRVTVFSHPDLSGEFEVDAAGFISMPLIGKVAAANGGAERLEAAIEEKLLDGYLKNPRISVEVLSLRAIYVLGEVGVPGSYPYTVGLTALKAVALAGGFSYRAKKNGMRVTRASEPEKGEQRIAGSAVISPGDIVVVPERFF
ncbi:MAG: polysaccharide export protein [Proteobacteria bacterium]|nr:polysaccharide export protein [Pseudomonadota bacterium]